MASEMNHILLVSSPGFGNWCPLLRLAQQMAHKGSHVTFSSMTSSVVGDNIQSTNMPSAAATDHFTRLGNGYIRFEYLSDGLESDDPRRNDQGFYQSHLKEVGSRAVSELVLRQERRGYPLSLVINGPLFYWVADVAIDMGIPCGFFWPQSCVIFSTYYHYYHKLLKFPTVEKPDAQVTLPGVPTTLSSDEISTYLLPRWVDEHTYTRYILPQFQNLHKFRWILVNSFEELEGGIVKAMAPLARLIPVGPLADPPATASDSLKASDEDDCIEWLDSKEPNSVVYVSLGTMVQISKEEMAEMMWGLIDSKMNFLWVVMHHSRFLLPEGFEEAIKDKGEVVRWCRQDQVLNHSAVACFLTHCGWNSTIECLRSGVPIISFPHIGDQVTNAKLLVDVYGVGVHLRRLCKKNSNVSSAQTPSFTREDVVKSVAEVVDGASAHEMRSNASKWKMKAWAAVSKEGSSHNNIDVFFNEALMN